MSQLGEIGWIDLTVPNAEAVRDFYQHGAGVGPSPVGMGDYQDYCMTPPGAAQPAAGICHARGHNADLPPAWLIYVTVGDLDEAVRRCQERGGKVRHPPEDMGGQGRYAIIEDPAGAVTGLFERR